MKQVDQNPLKINLGCGDIYLPGYIHIDVDRHDFIDYCHDFRTLPMFDDAVADMIYCCGALCYVDRVEAVDVLKEWRRVLKPGGVLRLSVTDFEKIIKLYNDSFYNDFGGNIEGLGILGPLFGRWEINDGQYIYFKTVYDFKSLKKMLETAGFHNVRRWDWKKVFPEGYDDRSASYVPHMDFENGTLVVLNIEADKI